MDREKAIELLDGYRNAHPGDSSSLIVEILLEILVKLCDIEKAIENTELGQHAFRR